MSDAEVRDLARRAGVSTTWNDYAGQRRRIRVDVLRRILMALDLPCERPGEREQSRLALDRDAQLLPPMLTATQGKSIALSASPNLPTKARLVQEDGERKDLVLRPTRDGSMRLPPIGTLGYHLLEIGDRTVTLAVAPARCFTIEDIAATRAWGLVAQVYGLRRAGDCGIGDMGAVAELARSAGGQHADALALSPTHAMFTADPTHFSPYSPSSRLFYNVLHANPHVLFSDVQVGKAIEPCGAEASQLEAARIIDWPRAASVKLAVFRRLFDEFSAHNCSVGDRLAADFATFRAEGGELLEQHALFEALHAHHRATDIGSNWLRWPAAWRHPDSAAITEFAQTHRHEILFHCFLQWLAARSLGQAQRVARDAGMRLGLLADLAVGMSSGGSHAWARESDILMGLSIGAPPDLFNARGQNWGLTTFSPRALVHEGFAPFIDTLRATMRYAGGLRIDHIMGLLRLWVLPDGVEPGEGAYLAYPLDDLLRLLALESTRHRAIVVGEDLGTVPPGFRDRLVTAGIAGMRVLWFEKDGERFAPPYAWSAGAAAMTSTHDLPTVVGWWTGADIPARERCRIIPDAEAERERRAKDRAALWEAFRECEAATGPPPDISEAVSVVGAAVRFVARTPCELALLPLEDALALRDQPNIPGTIDEYPNWRIRYPWSAAQMLDAADARARLRPLEKQSGQ